MVEIADITDRDSLKQWLTEWPVEQGLDENAARMIAVTLAHRAAMRVLPLYWAWTFSEDARERDVIALPILRLNLISGVGGKMLTPGIAAAAVAAARAAFAAADADATDATFAAARATFAAADATADATADAFAAATRATFATEAIATAAIWNNIRTDCAALAEGVALDIQALWSGDNPLQQQWQDVQRALPEGWDFWRRWYQDALDGRAPDWPLLQRIALIDPKTWDAGPEAVNAEIARIVEQRRLALDVREARAKLAEIRTQSATLAQRSHNHPPELVEADARISARIEIIWEALGEAEEELEKPDPEPSRLKRAGMAILRACKQSATYCAGLADTAFQKAAEEMGSAAGKWAVRGVAVWFAARNPQIQSLAGRVIEFAEKLAQMPH